MSYTIKQLIKILEKYPNQDATINFITNTTNVEEEVYDIEDCDIDFFGQDKDWVDSYDIMVFKDNENHNDECISELLYEHEKLTIELDCNDNHSNIVITDKDKNVLRDIQVGGRHRQNENITLRLRAIL